MSKAEDCTEKLPVRGPIVVVDDDQEFREYLREILEKAGGNVVAQDSGAHAVRYMQNQPWSWCPSMVITDIVMDGMGGYQLIRRIPELYPGREIPVIVISRLNAGVDVGEAEVAGAAAYLTKPVEPERLYDTIGKVVRNENKGMLVFTSDLGRRSLKNRMKSGRA